MQKTVFVKGDLLILTPDVYLSVSEVSPCFSARYVAMSENVLESAYYKITSVSLWEYLHYAPILRLSPAQQNSYRDGWNKRNGLLTNIHRARTQCPARQQYLQSVRRYRQRIVQIGQPENTRM